MCIRMGTVSSRSSERRVRAVVDVVARTVEDVLRLPQDDRLASFACRLVPKHAHVCRKMVAEHQIGPWRDG